MQPAKSINIIRSFALVLLLTFQLACDSGSNSGVVTPSTNPLARTSMVGHWNHVAVNASGFDHTVTGAKENAGPTKSSRAMAITHIAIHDAVQAIQQRYETYLPQEAAPADSSVEAAIAQAAYDALVALYPSQKTTFDSELERDLAGIVDGVAKENGIAAGHRSAKLILANRANDGADELSQSSPYKFSQSAGKWRVDPVNPTQQPLGPNWYKVKPFAIESASQFRAPTPPEISSPQYAEAYAEVYRLGGDVITTPTDRTENETNIGLFWAYDGTPSLCAPPRLYNQIVLQLAYDQGVTDLGDLARLLALANVSMADAGITSWETKYFYNYWRPVTGIREADAGTGPSGKGDNNPLTTGDVNWSPLGAPASNLSANNFTPPFPAYVSGHATFGGALFQTLRNYFGKDNIEFTFVSDELNGETVDHEGNVRPFLPRTFKSLSEAEEENGQSRIYLGIHWSFDKTEGIVMGNNVANYTFAKLLKAK
ncbi:MAG: phosphatase PAP2 family protein [Proteobacteria bacterium]|nr:phosphatase PAP2 family protein [Pseudomonadota bacterium]